MKEKLYRTAQATIPCAHFKAGEFVSVKFDGRHGGQNWYLINRTQNGPLEHLVAYPEHHLTAFCL